MTTFFVGCAVIGGTVLVVQFLLTLTGMLDIGVDFADDVSLDAGLESMETGHAFEHLGDWLWSMLSFRTLTAGLAFFGLGGLFMHARTTSWVAQLTVAVVIGLAAMLVVNLLMRAIYSLARDGSVPTDRAIGEIGTVYLTVPALKAGRGKVHVVVGGRLEEFAAITPSSDSLPVGAKVVVTAVEEGDTLEVALVDATIEKKLTSAT